MDLIVTSATLSTTRFPLSEADLLNQVVARLRAIPSVEHVRARLDGTTLAVGVFVTCAPDHLPAVRAAITEELSDLV